MSSLSTNLVLNGYKVLYITFEDSENKIAARIAQNMFNLSQTQFKSMSMHDFGKVFETFKKKCNGNNLIIKEYPEGSINAMNIKSLLKDLMDKKKFKPDVVFIDYIGCMIPNGRINPNMNTNTILLQVAQQVRSVAQEWSIPIVSAAQTNRGGYNAAEVGLNDIADSFGVNTKADAIIGVTQTPEIKEQGMYSVQLLKTRFGNNKGQVSMIGVDIEKQRIFDLNQANIKQSSMNVFETTKKASDDVADDLGELDFEL